MLFDVSGSIGVIRLNRPQALNALNLKMIRAIAGRLTAWATDSSVAAVLIRGGGNLAFCVGGDIRSLHDARAVNPSLFADFFRDEYTLNAQIKGFPKPYVALLDGVTMGGGVGLSVHGSHRVATDRFVFAMPETSIGMFPDVGGGYFLPRLPGQLGMYLALTGTRLRAADCLYAGIATHYVPHERLSHLTDEILSLDPTEDATAAIEFILTTYHVDPGPAPLAKRRALIDQCFAFDTVEAIFAALEREDDPFAQETLDDLRRKSPTALKVTVRQIRQGGQLDFAGVMAMEYRLAQRIMAGHDFYEGVRALLVDKDQKPQWRPKRIEDVSESDIEAHFAPLGAADLNRWEDSRT